MTMSLFTFVDKKLEGDSEPKDYSIFFIKDGKLLCSENIKFADAIKIGKDSNNEFIVFKGGHKVKIS